MEPLRKKSITQHQDLNILTIHRQSFYKVVKALYGLHQAPRAWYETLANYLLSNGFKRGKIDQTLFIKKQKGDILLVQVYVDDIIFGSTNKELCTGFEKLMKDKFSDEFLCGELTFFLGLQVQQKEDGICISQDKYVAEIIKKFNYFDVKSASTPVDLEKPLVKDGDADDVYIHLYRSMIGSLMYLTASRPDIMFVVCACARFQVTPKTSHLLAVKRIFRYLKGKPTLGLWYSRDSPFELVAYTDSDYAGATLDRKSTTGGCQFLGNRLISWQCKKQTVVATSTTEAEYVAAASCCGQIFLQKVLMQADSILCLSIEAESLNCISQEVGTPRYLSLVVPLTKVGDEVVHKELGDSMERAATTASSLESEHDSGSGPRCQDTILGDVNAQTRFEITSMQSIDPPLSKGYTLGSGEEKSSIWRDLHLDDAEGTDCLPIATIFEELARMRKKVFANMKRAGKDFSRRITPLFDTMMVKATEEEAKVPQDETDHEESVPTPSNDPQPSGEDSMQLTELIVLCTKFQTQVLDLQKAKDAQAKEIAALKKRIQRLERKKMSRPTGLKRLRKVGMSRRVESSEDQESLGAPEDASKQGRSIADIDANNDVALVDETQERQDDDLMFDTRVLDDDEMPVEAKVDGKDEQSNKPDDSTAGEAIKAAKPKVVTIAATTTTTTRPKARGVVVQEPSEFRVPQETQPSSSKDKGKGIMIEPEVPLKRKDQIALDEQIARDIQAKLDAELIEEQKLARKQEEEANIALIEEELTDEEKAKLFMELMEKRRKHFAALRAQEKRNRPPTKAQKRTQMSTYLKHMGNEEGKYLCGYGSKVQESKEKKVEGSEETAKGSRKKMLGRKRAGKEQQQKSLKKQKVKKENESDTVDEYDEAELKKLLVIKKDEDIAIDAIPLATKLPMIIDYNLHKEGMLVHYQLIRADGSSKRYSSMIRMLQGIDKEDLEALWRIVKAKYGDKRPKNEFERVLWGDLKVMFEPDKRSDVWRILQGYRVTIWKLIDSFGVHFVRRNLKIQKMNIKFRGGLLGLKRLHGFLKVTTAQVMVAPIISILSDSSEESVGFFTSESPDLPLVSPFLCSDDTEADEPAEQRPVSSSHDTLAPLSEFPLAPVVAPPGIRRRPAILRFVHRSLARTPRRSEAFRRWRPISNESEEQHMEVDTANAEAVADVGISEGVVAYPEDGVGGVSSCHRDRDDTPEGDLEDRVNSSDNDNRNGGNRDGENGNCENGNGGNGNPNENGRVFHISNFPEKSQVKYATCTLLNSALTWWNSHKRTIGTEAAFAMSWRELMKLMTEVYCLRNKIQKMEIELWNLTVKNNDLAAYTRRFQELTIMCTKMVPEEEDRGNVIAAEPTRLQDAIRIANNLMDQKLKGYAVKNAKNKRRFDVNQRDNCGQQPPYKRPNVGGQNMARAYMAGNNEKKAYNGLLPLCNKCKLHHEGPCTVRCGKCNKNMTITRSGMTPEAIKELVNQRVEEALAAYEATRAANALEAENQSQNGSDGDNRNGGDGNGRNGNGGNGNPNENNRDARPVARECTYHDFMKCQPLNFKGMEGVVGLIRWFEKMETVFHISNYPEKYQVKYATCTLLNSALTWWNSHKRTIGTNAAFAMLWRAHEANG
ncbi:putative ribonuclease H-like domain-containing protein [Tanacetum coccineum]